MIDSLVDVLALAKERLANMSDMFISMVVDMSFIVRAALNNFAMVLVLSSCFSISPGLRLLIFDLVQQCDGFDDFYRR